jgi:Domain of unknown function (DUF4431)
MTKTHLAAFWLLLCSSLAVAADFQYGKPAGLVGILAERTGIDCCINGREKKVMFPVVQLDQPINAASANAAKPDEDEMPENGVFVMQIVLASSELLATYKANKGKRVRVICSLFHAVSGHHLTPVLCDVIRITKPDES